MRIKRETGASPVQSRCCKLIKCFIESLFPLPSGGKDGETSKPEDLQDEFDAHIIFEERYGSLLYFIFIIYANLSHCFVSCSRGDTLFFAAVHA